MFLQILADAMGLGKTVMTISVIISNPGRGGVPVDPAVSGLPSTSEVSGSQLGMLSQLLEKQKKQIGPRKGGGTLIVCPMTLLGQWKVATSFTFTFTCPQILSRIHHSMLFTHLKPF